MLMKLTTGASSTASPSQTTMATSTITSDSQATTAKPTSTSTKPLETPAKTETPKKDIFGESSFPSKSKEEISTFKVKNGIESSKKEESTSPKISIEKPELSRHMDDFPKGAFIN